MYDPDDNQWNASILKYNHITPSVLGDTWLKGTITIEVFGCTRQRLIQTGSTNTHTYDFETSQGLYFCTSTRAAIPLPLTKHTETGPFKVDTLPINYIWGDNWDHWKKELIPQGYKKTYTVTFPRLPYDHMWRPRDWSSKDNYNYLIPGAQGITKTLDKDKKIGQQTYNNMTFIQEENFTHPGGDKGDESYTYTNTACFQPQVAWPCIAISQPFIPEETGYMKFKFSCRLTTQLQILRHLVGDLDAYNNSKTTPSTSNLIQGVHAYNLPYIKSVEDGKTGYYMMPFKYHT
jgi:hypothetical protein